MGTGEDPDLVRGVARGPRSAGGNRGPGTEAARGVVIVPGLETVVQDPEVETGTALGQDTRKGRTGPGNGREVAPGPGARGPSRGPPEDRARSLNPGHPSQNIPGMTGIGSEGVRTSPKAMERRAMEIGIETEIGIGIETRIGKRNLARIREERRNPSRRKKAELALSTVIKKRTSKTLRIEFLIIKFFFMHFLGFDERKKLL